MSLAAIDKLNILYYGEMELTTNEKKLRIVMASELQSAVGKYYDTVRAIIAAEKIDDRKRDLLFAAAVVSLRKAYLGFFDRFYERYVSSIYSGGEPYYGVEAWRQKHALDFAVWLTRTARNEPNTAFADSHSIEVTRTEVNAVGNLAALDAAYRLGARFKTWATFGDNKVRPSHKTVNGTRIPIDEAFTVGNSQLMFPNDTSLGADAEEIVNCRCTLKFDYGKVLTNTNQRGIIRVGSGRVEQAKRRDRKIYITDTAIKKVGRVRLSDFSEDQILIMQERHKALLGIAKDNNDSNEVLLICDTKFEKQVVVLGTEFTVKPGTDPNAVSLVANSPKYSLVYMHNHPSTNIFSAGDIDTFVCDGAIKTMSVVTNQGEVYIINKTSGYDFEKTRHLLMDIYRSLPEAANKSDEFVKEFLKRCKEGGIEYGK